MMVLVVMTLCLSFTIGFMYAPPKARYTNTDNHIHNSLLLGRTSDTFSSYPFQTRKEWRRTNVVVTNSILFSTLNSKNNGDDDCGDDDGMPVLPSGVVKYSQVPKQGKFFTASTIPSGLLKQHTTKKGTWGIINVSQGKLEYSIVSSEGEEVDDHLSFELSPQAHGIIEPQRLHQVKPMTEDVQFVVEFLRLPGTGPVNEKREGL